MAGEDETGGGGGRRLPLPRGRVQVGSVVSTLVGVTGLLSWLGLHPGGASSPTGAHPTPTAEVALGLTSPLASDLPVVSLPQITAVVEVHPTLQLNPSAGAVGTEVRVSAAGFPAEVEVDVSLQALNLGTARADGSGRFSLTVRIPDFFSGLPGRYPMEAVQRDSTNRAEEFFTVT